MIDRNLNDGRLAVLGAGLVLTLGVFSACGGGHEAGEHLAAADHEAAGHEAAGHETAAGADAAASADATGGAPRVFFTNVSDGDEVTSPVRLEFDVENFEIVAAHDPAVIEAGKGHHHLAVNGDCEPPGVVLPKAAPWIHFGDASRTIDVQLPPGPVHLTLQVGDGEHRTLDEPGLCTSIDLTVVEGETPG
ncbi:MAG: DUF4399 domain-containing protein [Acidobacteriota bacterium]|nr:DUF4399 domain-containing protein [Acidobacteriota bacterium]MDH3523842.1 DUF4399 domain-containing protein [Acidobacteriota bacterium]